MRLTCFSLRFSAFSQRVMSARFSCSVLLSGGGVGDAALVSCPPYASSLTRAAFVPGRKLIREG